MKNQTKPVTTLSDEIFIKWKSMKKDFATEIYEAIMSYPDFEYEETVAEWIHLGSKWNENKWIPYLKKEGMTLYYHEATEMYSPMDMVVEILNPDTFKISIMLDILEFLENKYE